MGVVMSWDETQTDAQSFPAGCLETPPILSIYHLGVTFSTIDLSTWNLANDQKNDLKLRRRGKCLWSRMLNILCLFNTHTSQVTERPALLAWKARFPYGARHLAKQQRWLQQKNQCLSNPIGTSTSKSIFYPAFLQHLLIFQQLTLVSLSILTSGMRLKWLRAPLTVLPEKMKSSLRPDLLLCRGRGESFCYGCRLFANWF